LQAGGTILVPALFFSLSAMAILYPTGEIIASTVWYYSMLAGRQRRHFFVLLIIFCKTNQLRRQYNEGAARKNRVI